MTKDEVLQKANEYCGEKGYTKETLTDDYKDKFADFFVKRHPDEDINDESIIDELKFNFNTAFSATSKGVTAKQQAYDKMVEEYNGQIEELKKKIGNAEKKGSKKGEETTEGQQIPQELLDKLDKLEKIEIQSKKDKKVKEVLALAKKGVRTDLHKSLENYATDFDVSLETPSEEQANRLIERFQAIFRDSIGDVKPLSPKMTRKQDDEFAKSLKPIKV